MIPEALNFYKNDEEGLMLRLTSIVEEVDDLCYLNHWDKLNDRLVKLNPESTDVRVVITWLRTASCVREKLKDWNSVLTKVHTNLLKYEMDADRVLRGLR